MNLLQGFHAFWPRLPYGSIQPLIAHIIPELHNLSCRMMTVRKRKFFSEDDDESLYEQHFHAFLVFLALPALFSHTLPSFKRSSSHIIIILLVEKITQDLIHKNMIPDSYINKLLFRMWIISKCSHGKWRNAWSSCMVLHLSLIDERNTGMTDRGFARHLTPGMNDAHHMVNAFSTPLECYTKPLEWQGCC